MTFSGFFARLLIQYILSILSILYFISSGSGLYIIILIPLLQESLQISTFILAPLELILSAFKLRPIAQIAAPFAAASYAYTLYLTMPDVAGLESKIEFRMQIFGCFGFFWSIASYLVVLHSKPQK